ncbi:MAG: nuclear transport factor 2 family protein [Pseudohongiellaceae bacterium]
MFKNHAVFTVVLLLTTGIAVAQESVYWACSNLVTDYAFHRDQFNAEEFANLFTEDASLTVVNQTWVGRSEISQRIEDLKTGSTIRHEMSTIRIVPIDENHATGVSYATIYAAPEGITTVNGFVLMGEYHDEFVRTSDGWRISKRVLIPKYSLEP